MNRHTIAIVGLGAAARTIHLPAYRRLPNLEVVAGCDPATRPGEFPFPVFVSAEAMLARVRPDILCIATPPDSHAELCRLGLDAGCHLFCEKPFVADLDEGRDLVARARQARRWIVVNNQYRFMRIHQAARDLAGDDSFGDLRFLSIEQTMLATAATEAGWRGHTNRRTCFEFGTHVLDLCRYFFAAEPTAVTARMPRVADPDADLLNLIRLDFPGQRTAQIVLDRICHGPHRYLTTRLDGTRGCIETAIGGKAELRVGLGRRGLPYAGVEFAGGGSATLHHAGRSRRIAADSFDLFVRATSRLMKRFLAALENDAVPPCHAADNLRTLALVFAAYRSNDENRTIEIDDPVASLAAA